MNILLFFIIGTMLGSLGSVLILRLANGWHKTAIEGILRGRSLCPHCKHTLSWRDLFPLISYCLSWGKCRHCGAPISKFYPLLELLSGSIIALTVLVLPGASRAAIWFRVITNRLLLLLLVYDIQTFELHTPIWHILMVRILWWGLTQNNILFTLQSTLITLGIFLLIYRGAKRYVKKRGLPFDEGLGIGDVYLGGSLGILIPFVTTRHMLPQSIDTVIKLIILLFLWASLIGIITYASTKTKSQMLPFFPGLIVARRILSIRTPRFLALLS